MKALSKYC